MRELVGERNIEDLPISFTAVATDVDEQKEVWLRHGSLFDAIRASIAVPLVFTPHRVQGRYLLDGGLINPVPIAPTLNDDTDLTIAVNLSGPPTREPARVEIEHRPVLEEYRRRIKQFIETLGGKSTEVDEDERGFFEVLTQVVDTVENTIARFKLAAYSPDYIVEIPRNACALFDFHRAGELIALGWQRAEQTLAHIRDD
ncbi:MAG TPA: hypothetical protein ENH15_06415 [Actinobacteria bacterium]|nr:hypothetical protein [Actinomycetota bacterium]